MKYASRKIFKIHLSLGSGIAHLSESLWDLGSEHKPVKIYHVKLKKILIIGCKCDGLVLCKIWRVIFLEQAYNTEYRMRRKDSFFLSGDAEENSQPMQEEFHPLAPASYIVHIWL